MGQYRKKPVVIDAFKWTADEHQTDDPVWIVEAIKRGDVLIGAESPPEDPTIVMRIKTLEGWMTGQIGDYIIRGIKGEIYPCKPDIFEASYDAVDLNG